VAARDQFGVSLLLCVDDHMVMLLVLQLALPNATTPGTVRGLTKQAICATRWGVDRRHVTAAMRRQVLKNYDVHEAACCEIDHKVPRELGGADVVANLWPQPWAEARLKDVEENAYHRNVCAGRMTLYAAQYHFLHWGER
jgi:hypothetical protein